jgi:hypothetical protein
MSSRRVTKGLSRTAGALIGAVLALGLLLGARPAANGSPLPAAIRFAMAPTGELEVTPPAPEPLLAAHSLIPGRGATATFTVRNQTGESEAVAFRATADSTALDGLLRIRLRAAGRLLADTTLQGMRRRTEVVDLSSGAESRFRLQAWIPAEIRNGYEGRSVSVTLTPEMRAIGGRG